MSYLFAKPALKRRLSEALLLTSMLGLAVGGFAACGDDSMQQEVDAGDAGPIPCSDFEPLIIGQCIDEATGAPCLDFVSTTRSWISLADTQVIPPIIGLQNSPMFVLSVSGAGIAPGEDSDAPYVELVVTQGEEVVGGYAARPTVIDDPNEPGNILASQLYVVAFFAEDLAGQTVQVKAEVRDRIDRRWCTESSFQVGTLVP